MSSYKAKTNKLQSVFIAGTDTEAGKTIVAGLLGRFIAEKGYNVITQKWIQTGCNGFPDDVYRHLELMKIKRVSVKDYMEHICPYTFKIASSPHLASRLEKRKIRQGKIKNSFSILHKKFDCIVVEGTGGVLVPFNNKKLLIDIASQLDLPVLLVSSNRLGCINHTLLTVEAIKVRGLKLLGIIFDDQNEQEKSLILKDNPKIIKLLTKERVFGRLPWLKDTEELYKAFIPAAGRILAELQKANSNG